MEVQQKEWIKKGLIFSKHHAQLPTVYEFDEKIYCLYSTRNNNNQSVIMSLTIDNNGNVIEENGCVLSLGERGCFDEHGVMPSCTILQENTLYLFYTGWYVSNDSYTHSIGIATSKDGKTFKRLFNYPIVGRGEKIPYMANSPFVIKEKKEYIMFFGNGTGWCNKKPLYSLGSAKSNQLTENWKVNNEWIIFEEGGIYSRCFVEKTDIYYSYYNGYKTGNYKIYKNNKIAIDLGDSWDQEMTAYPYIYKDIMFYNGNGYGQTGIGIATRNQTKDN